MGSVTRAKLLGHVKEEEIINYIYHNWDKDVRNGIKYYSYNDWKGKDFIKKTYEEDMYERSGFITFKYKGEYRNLFYCYNSYNTYENLDYYKEYGLENMVKSETTYISLGYYGDSVEIIKELVSYFGGWFELDDCDNQSYYYIPSTQTDRRKEFPPVIYMTQEELNKHFGGIVVIKNK